MLDFKHGISFMSELPLSDEELSQFSDMLLRLTATEMETESTRDEKAEFLHAGSILYRSISNLQSDEMKEYRKESAKTLIVNPADNIAVAFHSEEGLYGHDVFLKGKDGHDWPEEDFDTLFEYCRKNGIETGVVANTDSPDAVRYTEIFHEKAERYGVLLSSGQREKIEDRYGK